MNKYINFICIVFSLFITQITHAAELGVFFGGNYAYSNWFTSTRSDQFILKGYGGMGGVSLSFNQYQRFGFRIAALDYFVNQSTLSVISAQAMSMTGSVPVGFAVLDVNFDLGPNRHSFGLGYGYESLSSLTFSGTGTYPASTSASGVVLDGKDFWKNGWFDYVVLFFPRDNLSA